MKFLTLLTLMLVSALAGAVEARFPLLNFDQYELYRNSLYGGNSEVLETGDGLVIKGNAKQALLRERKFQLKTFRDATAIELRGELRQGTAGFRVKGEADGKPFETAIAPLRSGAYDVRVALPAAEILKLEAVELISNSGEWEALLSGADLICDKNPAQALEVRLAGGRRLAILEPGEALEVEVCNRSNQEVTVDAEFELTPFLGESMRMRQRITVGGGECLPLRLGDNLPLAGHWDVNWKFRNANDEHAGTLGVAVLERLPEYREQAGDFWFGMCSHPNRWAVGERELEAQAAQRIGVMYLRSGVDWNRIQPRPEVWDYEDYDALVDLFTAYGIRLQGMFGFCTQWAARPELRDTGNWHDWSRAKPDLDAWREYIRRTAERYRGRIAMWEIWNEPDLTAFSHFSVKDYIDLARVAHETVKQVDPELLVLSAGFAGLGYHPGRKDPDYQKKAIAGGKDYFDIHAYHGHSAYPTFRRQIDERLLPMRREVGATLPWYANETAVTALGGAERRQAEALFKKLIFCWSRGSIGYNWYDLRNDGWSKTDPEHHFGTLTTDFQAKPVLTVYHTLARYLRGARFVKDLTLPEGCDGFEFESTEGRLLAVWNEARAMTGPVAVLSDASGVVRIDLMGNRSAVQSDRGVFLMEIPESPVFYLLENATDAAVGGALFDLTAPPVIAGQPFSMRLTLRNPFTEKMNFKVGFEAAAGMHFAAAEQTAAVAANDTATLTFTGRCDADARPEEVVLVYGIAGTPFSGELKLPLPAGIAIPAGDGNYRRRPDFVLNQPSQAVSFGEGDPSKRHLVWTGPEDLSAAVFLRLDGEVLELYVGVIDDVHCQPEIGTRIWLGDSVQFALSIPGQNGAWKIGLAHGGDGKPQRFVWEAPTGFDAAAATQAIRLTTNRNDANKGTAYRARLPLAAFGLTPERLRGGIRFNLLVNDNDGEIRESYLTIAPGLSEWKDFESFPLVVFESGR